MVLSKSWVELYSQSKHSPDFEIWYDYEGDFVVYDILADRIYGTFGSVEDAENLVNNLMKLVIKQEYYYYYYV